MPTFPSAPQYAGDQAVRSSTDGWGAVTAAVDPANPQWMFAGDGTVVMRSVNGGCTWQQAFSLYADGTPTDGSTELQPWADPSYVVRDIEVTGTGNRSPHVYLALTDFVGEPPLSVEPVYIAASADGGNHWSTHPVTDGTGPAGRFQSSAHDYDGADVFASPSSPTTVYYGSVFYGGVNDGTSSTYTLLVSHDSGATWHVVSATQLQSGGLSEFVDPRSPATVWRSYDTTGGSDPQLAALRSVNSGAAFHAVLQGAPPGPAAYDPPYISGVLDHGHTCLVSRSASATYLSTTDGQRWRRLGTLPQLDARSGPAYVEGASCIGHGQAVAMGGYQPQRFKAPPFTRSALYLSRGSSWYRVAALPHLLVDGSLSVAGVGSHPEVFWFGLKNTDTYGSTTPSDCVWYRLRL